MTKQFLSLFLTITIFAIFIPTASSQVFSKNRKKNKAPIEEYYHHLYEDKVSSKGKVVISGQDYFVEKTKENTYVYRLYLSDEHDILISYDTYADKDMTTRIGSFVSWNAKGIKIEEGQYLENCKSGIWNKYDRNTGELLETMTYYKGVLEENKEIENNEIFKVVEQMPYFKGCEDLGIEGLELKKCGDQKMLEYIYKNIRYPVQARDNGIEGTTVLGFIINEEGYVEEPRLIRRIGGQCELEGLRIIKRMNIGEPLWVSGVLNGQPVKIHFNIPVKFRLE